jgi:hypothetical protein
MSGVATTGGQGDRGRVVRQWAMADASALQVSPDEIKAAILLFYSRLDER